MKKASILILSWLMLFTLQVYAQTQVDIAAKLEEWNSKLPIEKAHLHLDKPYYSVGDTIWIKAYVTDRNNQLSDISNIVYVDLINDKDAIKTSLVMPLINGQAWGAITLCDSLFSAGNYKLRAYTTLMRNYGADYFFNKSIAIVNSLPLKRGMKLTTEAVNSNQLVNKTEKQDNINLQFFPEGGDLVVGIPSKVAFKAISTDGLSRQVTGYIIDKDNNRIAEVRSEHAGMGTFKLFPTEGNTYSAVINVNGAEVKYPLPNAKKNGYGLSVTQTKEDIQVMVMANTPSTSNNTLNLIAQANNQVLYSGRAELKNSGFLTYIPKKYFSEGIVQITLLNADFKLIAERLVFVKQANQQLKIDLNNITDSLKKSGRSIFKIKVTDGALSPAPGTFSMAVTDDDKVPYNEDDEISIFSNLLLTADLKGYIEQPNYYFTDTSATRQRELDNLLLTQGWRRFVWDDVLNNKTVTPIYKPETGDISGVVLDNKKQPVSGAQVTLLFKTGDKLVLDTVTDAKGRFSFNGIWPDKDDQYIVMATNKTQNIRYNAELDDQLILIPPVVKQPFISPAVNLLDVFQKAAKKDYEDMQDKGLLNSSTLLKEVKIVNKKQPLAVKDVALIGSSNLGGKKNSNTVVTFKDLMPCGSTTDLGNCLISIGKLNNIIYAPTKQDPTLLVFYSRLNGSRMIGNSAPMAIIQDGMQVKEYLGTMNEIASIEIVKSAAYSGVYGNVGANGLIIINTKKPGVDYGAYGNDYRDGQVSSMSSLSNASFAPRREFYVPKYDPENKNVRPRQSTIYWAPNIITDGKGAAMVEFPAAITPGRYRIIIEGIDANGTLGRKVYKYGN